MSFIRIYLFNVINTEIEQKYCKNTLQTPTNKNTQIPFYIRFGPYFSFYAINYKKNVETIFWLILSHHSKIINLLDNVLEAHNRMT